jgi:hypothetical protein
MNRMVERLLDRVVGSTLFQLGVFGGLGLLIYTFWLRPTRAAHVASTPATAAPAAIEDLMPGMAWGVLREATSRASVPDMLRWSAQVLKVRSS